MVPKRADIWCADIGGKEKEYNGGPMKGTRPVIILNSVKNRSTFVPLTSDINCRMVNIWELYVQSTQANHLEHSSWADITNVQTMGADVFYRKLGGATKESMNNIQQAINDYYSGILYIDEDIDMMIYNKDIKERVNPAPIDLKSLSDEYNFDRMIWAFNSKSILVLPSAWKNKDGVLNENQSPYIPAPLQIQLASNQATKSKYVPKSKTEYKAPEIKTETNNSKTESISQVAPVKKPHISVPPLNNRVGYDESRIMKYLYTFHSDKECPILLNMTPARYSFLSKLRYSEVEKNCSTAKEYAEFMITQRYNSIKTIYESTDNKEKRILECSDRLLQSKFQASAFSISLLKQMVKAAKARKELTFVFEYKDISSLDPAKAMLKYMIGQPEYDFIMAKKTTHIDSDIIKYIGNATLDSIIQKSGKTYGSMLGSNAKEGTNNETYKSIVKNPFTSVEIPNSKPEAIAPVVTAVEPDKKVCITYNGDFNKFVKELLDGLSKDDIKGIRGLSKEELGDKYGLSENDANKFKEIIGFVSLYFGSFSFIKDLNQDERLEFMIESGSTMSEKYNIPLSKLYNMRTKIKKFWEYGAIRIDSYETKPKKEVVQTPSLVDNEEKQEAPTTVEETAKVQPKEPEVDYTSPASVVGAFYRNQLVSKHNAKMVYTGKIYENFSEWVKVNKFPINLNLAAFCKYFSRVNANKYQKVLKGGIRGYKGFELKDVETVGRVVS